MVVLLTDYHVTTCNKCNVKKDVDGRLVITMTLTIAIYEIKHINVDFPFVYFDFRSAFHWAYLLTGKQGNVAHN